MENKEKSVWGDIVKTWGRIAGVISASGILATVITKIFNTSPELTYSLFITLGVILLIVSFYVDKQAEYTHQEIIRYEQQARKDFTDAINNQKESSIKYQENTEKKIQHFEECINKLITTTEETRKDTLRIQLLMILEQQPENIDTILKLAETYFVNLHGDWYMTSEFKKWAKKHDIEVPNKIYNAIDENHKEM